MKIKIKSCYGLKTGQIFDAAVHPLQKSAVAYEEDGHRIFLSEGEFEMVQEPEVPKDKDPRPHYDWDFSASAALENIFGRRVKKMTVEFE